MNERELRRRLVVVVAVGDDDASTSASVRLRFDCDGVSATAAAAVADEDGAVVAVDATVAVEKVVDFEVVDPAVEIGGSSSWSS